MAVNSKNASTENLTEMIISDEAEREQRIHELLRGRRSLNINIEVSKKMNLSDKLSDKMARFAGSWSFVLFFGSLVVVWAVANTELIIGRPFDPYPYVFLNLILACVSSLQAPIIMMSQNKDAQKDRLRAENEYLINLKSEIILEDLHMKMDEIIKVQEALKNDIKDIKMDINESLDCTRSDMNGKRDTGREEPGLCDGYNRFDQ